MKISHMTYKDTFSGIKVIGDNYVEAPTGEYANWHMHRAFYITSQLEAPIWGAVQSYDGAGMSGGPFHWIAVYPKNMEQGPLFQLLRRIEITKGAPVGDLWKELATQGWYVAMDGKLRNIKTGGLIGGREIRNVFTPPNGKVPKTGPQRNEAEKWAVLFHKLLADPKTYHAQAVFSIEYLMKSQAALEIQAYNYFIKVQTPELLGSREDLKLPEEVDLAMCIYHSFSVNAPAIAKSCLETTMKEYEKKKDSYIFAKTLIKKLGTRKYGRWADVPGEKGSRYDWTRNACIKAGFWDKNLVKDLLPRDF